MVDVRSGVFGRSNRQAKELGTPSRHVTTSHGQLQARATSDSPSPSPLLTGGYLTPQLVSYLCLSLSLFLFLCWCSEPAAGSTVHCHQMDVCINVHNAYSERFCTKLIWNDTREMDTKQKKFQKLLHSAFHPVYLQVCSLKWTDKV